MLRVSDRHRDRSDVIRFSRAIPPDSTVASLFGVVIIDLLYQKIDSSRTLPQLVLHTSQECRSLAISSKLFIDLLLGSAVRRELECLRKRFMSAGVTERELRDINLELTRQKLQLELFLLRHDIKRLGINLKKSYIDAVEAVLHELSSGRLIQKRRLDEMLEQLGAIR